MKKMAVLWLALLLTALCAAGLCDAQASVEQNSCSIVQSGEDYLVYCFAQVRNDSDSIICLDHGSFALMNGDQIMASEEISRLWPYFLEPGDEGYFFDVVVFSPNEDGPVVPSLTGVQYDAVYMAVDDSLASSALSATSRIEKDLIDGGLVVVCEVENGTDVDAYDPILAFGLYTAGGQMIYADGMTMNYIGIPAGGKVLARFQIDAVFAQQWEQYGVTPMEARFSASFRDDKD